MEMMLKSMVQISNSKSKCMSCTKSTAGGRPRTSGMRPFPSMESGAEDIEFRSSQHGSNDENTMTTINSERTEAAPELILARSIEEH
jgi:hypothetical protein